MERYGVCSGELPKKSATEKKVTISSAANVSDSVLNNGSLDQRPCFCALSQRSVLTLASFAGGLFDLMFLHQRRQHFVRRVVVFRVKKKKTNKGKCRFRCRVHAYSTCDENDIVNENHAIPFARRPDTIYGRRSPSFPQSSTRWKPVNLLSSCFFVSDTDPDETITIS